MAYFRKLPSGKWQATVRGANGKKYTNTDPLKKVVQAWAAEEETKVRQGRWRDPRAARIPFAEFAEKWFAARVVEDETRRQNYSSFTNHISPHWASWRMSDITRLDVQTWVRRLQKDGVGPHAISKAYYLFVSMMSDAVDAEILVESPCKKKVDLPATPTKLPAWFTRDQADRIRTELEKRWHGDKWAPLEPAQRGHSVMVELMVSTGLRWGEAAAVVGAVDDKTGVGNPVDWLRGRIRVIGSLSQHGKWKSYPKTTKSRREVPVPPDVLKEMSALLVDRDRTSLVFVSRHRKQPLHAANWRLLWYQAIDKANEHIAEENRKLPAARRIDPIPRLDPHDCRHTAASWWVQDGMDLYQVMEYLGHESFETTQRYAHLAPDKHEAIEESWKRRRRSREGVEPTEGAVD